MNILPGWYGVLGTSDVRWWDGAKFRQVVLRDGRPEYEKSRSQSPVMSLVLGALFVVLGIIRMIVNFDDEYGFAMAVAFVILGVISIVLGVRGHVVEQLPPPAPQPYADPRSMPWPWQTEPGPIAPGWYAAPSRRVPRWWTGARWSEYLILRKFPMPVAGQRSRQVAVAWIVGIAFALFTLMGVALWVVGAREDNIELSVVGGVMTVMFCGLGIFLMIYMAQIVRIFTMPSMPPGYRA